ALDVERHATHGRHRARLGLVGHLEVPPRQDAHRSRSFGLRISSSANPHRVNASTTNTIASPGGTSHHHWPELAAPAPNACSRVVPHDVERGSPRPRNDRVVSDRIAIATRSTVLAK